MQKTCHSKAAVDQITGAKDYKPEPGELIFTEYTRPASLPLPPINGESVPPT